MRRQLKSHQLNRLAFVLLFALTNFSIGLDTAKSERIPREGTPVMWREPTDIASRDLFLGSGGETLKPDLSRLSQLSDRQIEDAFRAANYSSEDVRLLAGAFRKRINRLAELSDLRATVRFDQ